MANTVKIGMVGAAIKTQEITSGMTIEQAIKASGFNPEGFDVIVNSTKTTGLRRNVSANDIIILTRQVKGNGYATVTLSLPNGRTDDQLVDTGGKPTVATVLDQAGYNLAPSEAVFNNGTRLDGWSGVYEGMVLTVKVETPVAEEVEDSERILLSVHDETAQETEDEFEAEESDEGFEAEEEPKYEAEVRFMSPDPDELTILAAGFFEEATSLRELAADALHQAAKLEAKSKDFNLRSADITAAFATFETAKSAVVALGVPVPKDSEPEVEPTADPREALLSDLLEAMSYKDLVELAKTRGVNAKGKKSELVARLMEK